ncbi:hypothetical protein UK82_29800 [Frankia sp. ACN1ag]|nr:hypothetical protein UK82_29800 [Frankia sp. ACN1ag]
MTQPSASGGPPRPGEATAVPVAPSTASHVHQPAAADSVSDRPRTGPRAASSSGGGWMPVVIRVPVSDSSSPHRPARSAPMPATVSGRRTSRGPRSTGSATIPAGDRSPPSVRLFSTPLTPLRIPPRAGFIRASPWRRVPQPPAADRRRADRWPQQGSPQRRPAANRFPDVTAAGKDRDGRTRRPWRPGGTRPPGPAAGPR